MYGATTLYSTTPNNSMMKGFNESVGSTRAREKLLFFGTQLFLVGFEAKLVLYLKPMKRSSNDKCNIESSPLKVSSELIVHMRLQIIIDQKTLDSSKKLVLPLFEVFLIHHINEIVA